MADTTWDDAVQLILDGLYETLISKQHDYGHENILFAGADGVLVRAHDKIARIKNLLGRGAHAENESLRDSWIDLAGYAVIAIMLMDGTFTRPLACDMPNSDPQNIAATYADTSFEQRNLEAAVSLSNSDYWKHSDGVWRTEREERDGMAHPITEGHVKAWIAQAVAHHVHSMHETETWPRSHYINEL
jgi:hypothetical protein